MRARLLIAAAAAVTLLACSDSSTAPRGVPPVARVQDDEPAPEEPGEDPSEEGTCRSGFTVATREDGSLRCYPDQ